MNKKLLIFSLIPLVLLSRCVNQTEINKRIVDEVASNMAIAVLTTGKNTRPLFTNSNHINKPTSFNPREHPNWITIPASSLRLALFFEYEKDIIPTISWTFSDSSVFIINYPISELVTHANVSIAKYPDLGKSIEYTLKGVVEYQGATAETTYSITLENIDPNVPSS